MHDELTAQDIEQMRAELRQRKTVLLPQLRRPGPSAT